MIISEEKLATLKESDSGYLCSKQLNASNIPGIQYFLTVYPNGSDKSSSGNVLIFLHVNLKNGSNVKVDGKFCIDSAEFSAELKIEYQISEGRGCLPCKTDDLFDSTKNFIVDGTFVLTFEGILSADKEKTENGNEINLVAGHLGPLFWMNEDKDFTINVGENSVKVSFSFTLLFCHVAYINLGPQTCTRC